MADVIDYLHWRGDLTLEERPFNEVDNVVLSLLTYTKFDEVLSSTTEPIPLDDVRREYFRYHTREEIQNIKIFNGQAPLLMDDLAETKRFHDMKIGWYVSDLKDDETLQFAAVTYILPNGEAYVGFRGTDNSVTGWREDLLLSYMSGTQGQLLSVNYLNEHFSDMCKEDIEAEGFFKAVYNHGTMNANLTTLKELLESKDLTFIDSVSS